MNLNQFARWVYRAFTNTWNRLFTDETEFQTFRREITMTIQEVAAKQAALHAIVLKAIDLINGFGERLKAAGTDAAALDALGASIQSDADALSADVAANAPAPVVDPAAPTT